ncbi:hypothetical protein LAV82_22605 [Bacillus sp. ILBB4]|nr:hypothetical protein [Bacillus sp. ILBB4]
MTINETVREKRVFSQQTERDYRHLILDSNKIKKCIYFDYVILIKQGDLPYPKRWLRYFSLLPQKGQVVPVENYNREDYEYIFLPYPGFSDEMKKELELLGQPTDDSNKFSNFLIQLDEIPDHLLPLVKKEITSCFEQTTEPPAIDAYVYEEQGETAYLILEFEDNPHDIDEDATTRFQSMETLQTYELPGEHKRLYKVNEPDAHYNSERWFVYSYEDANFPYLEELHELEDLLPYTAFKELQVK